MSGSYFWESENSTTGVVLDFGKLWGTKHLPSPLMRNIFYTPGKSFSDLLQNMGFDTASPTLDCQSITCNNYTHLVSGNINHQSIVAVASNGEGEKKEESNKTYWSISLYNIFEQSRSKKRQKFYKWQIVSKLTSFILP